MERKIQGIGNFLWIFCHGHQNSWNQFLGWAEYEQNYSWAYSVTSLLCSGGLGDHWMSHQEVPRSRGSGMQLNVWQMKTPTFPPGQKVWFWSTRDFMVHLSCKKLSPRYIGPFSITWQIDPVTYQLQFPSHYKIHSSFHVSILKPYQPPVSVPTEPGPAEQPYVDPERRWHAKSERIPGIPSWSRVHSLGLLQKHTPFCSVCIFSQSITSKVGLSLMIILVIE